MPDIILIILIILAISTILIFLLLIQSKKNSRVSVNEITQLLKQNNELDLKIKSLADLFNGNHDRLRNF